MRTGTIYKRAFSLLHVYFRDHARGELEDAVAAGVVETARREREDMEDEIIIGGTDTATVTGPVTVSLEETRKKIDQGEFESLTHTELKAAVYHIYEDKDEVAEHKKLFEERQDAFLKGVLEGKASTADDDE
jgi:hypothetical protein